jgi:hypothetical protein
MGWVKEQKFIKQRGRREEKPLYRRGLRKTEPFFGFLRQGVTA